MSIKLPTRFDEEYTKIAKFEKYEYTHCLTYEFARRNSYVEDLLNLLFELFLYYEQIISPTLIKYEKATVTDDMIDAIKDVENIYKKFFMDILKHYNKKQFVDDFDNLSFENIKEKMSYLVHSLAKELYDDYYIIYQHEPDKFTSDFHEIYDPLIYLERDKALTEHIKNTYENKVNLKEYYKFNSDKNQYFTSKHQVSKHQVNYI